MADQKTQDPTEYRIREDCLPWLKSKFDRMQKIAKEVGAEPPICKVLREEIIKFSKMNTLTGEDETHFTKYYWVKIAGKAPKLKNWEFVGTITYTPKGNLINKIPSAVADVPARFRTSNPWCDYCKTSRARVDTFIVRNGKTGEYKQIGRNCLAKFLGYSNPERVAEYAKILSSIRDDIANEEEEEHNYGSHQKGSKYIPLLPFLTMTAAVIREEGWCSVATARSHEGKVPTLSRVYDQLFPIVRNRYWEQHRIITAEEDKKRAEDAIAFARSDKLKEDTDFKHNLKVATSDEFFHMKAAGIVAALLSFQDRDKEWEIMQQKRREESDKRKEEYRKKVEASEFQGEVGERITVPVEVIRERELSSQYGVTHMYRMLDAQNNIYVWFASNRDLEVGKRYLITGSVKKHDEYEGMRQTVITRCKAEEIPDLPAEPVVVITRKTAKGHKTSVAKRESSTGLVSPR